jgi:HlyD family secretion protein
MGLFKIALPLLDVVGKRKKTTALVTLLGLGLVGGAVALTRGTGQKENWDRYTTTVKTEDVKLRVVGSGSVQPVKIVNVSPKTAGRVMELLVDQGDRVTQGQVIARMDDQDAVAEVDQARANLAAAQAKLETLQNPTRGEAIAQANASVDQTKSEIDQADGEISRVEGQKLQSQGEVLRTEGAVGDAQFQLEFANRQLERQQALAKEGAISANSLDEFVRKQQSASQALKQAKAQLGQAQAQVDQAEAQLVQAQAKRSQSGSRRTSAEAQRLQQNQSGSSGEIAQAKAQVAASSAQLQAAQNRLGDMSVRAPFDGLITQRYANVGAFVTPTTQAASGSNGGATSTSIFALANGLEVLAKVPEVDISQIKPNQTVEISADAYPEDKFTGKVRLIAPEAVVEQSVTYFQVRVAITSGFNKLKSGMNADLNFTGKEVKGAVMVPTVAIVTKRGKPGVLINGKDNKLEFKPVTIGSTIKGKTQVVEGLGDGDRIFKELPPGQTLDKILKGSKGDKAE